MSAAFKTVTIEGRFAMYRGGYLESPTLAYETWGVLNVARDNGILIFSGLSPSAHAAASEQDPSAGWWEEMIGPGSPLDTDQFFVIAVNSLGSCFGSTGPASVNPETGQIYRLKFPVLTMEDIAESTHRVVLHLGIERLHAVIGCSMGGMSGRRKATENQYAIVARDVENTPCFISQRRRLEVPATVHGEPAFDRDGLECCAHSLTP